MICLSTLIETFEAELRERYAGSLLPSHLNALAAMKQCRTTHSALMQVQCADCDRQDFIPHSCGHHHCPHCQQHEGQLKWTPTSIQKMV